MKRRIHDLSTVCVFISITFAIAQQDVLTQFSTIDALVAGLYHGEMTVDELPQYGDFGLGTFDALDGEMIIIDGQCYQIPVDGSVRIPDGDLKTPFVALTFFEVDRKVGLRDGMDFSAFSENLSNLIPGQNRFYALRIRGQFRNMKVRSVPRQKEPYPPLSKVIENQTIFNLIDVEGVIAGFRCPPYVKGINMPGDHLHFISADRKTGGHVLEFNIQNAELEIDYISRFSLIVPSNPAFHRLKLPMDEISEQNTAEK